MFQVGKQSRIDWLSLERNATLFLGPVSIDYSNSMAVTQCGLLVWCYFLLFDERKPRKREVFSLLVLFYYFATLKAFENIVKDTLDVVYVIVSVTILLFHPTEWQCEHGTKSFYRIYDVSMIDFDDNKWDVKWETEMDWLSVHRLFISFNCCIVFRLFYHWEKNKMNQFD